MNDSYDSFRQRLSMMSESETKDHALSTIKITKRKAPIMVWDENREKGIDLREIIGIEANQIGLKTLKDVDNYQ